MSDLRLCFVRGREPAALLYFADADPADVLVYYGEEPTGFPPRFALADARRRWDGTRKQGRLRVQEFVLIDGGPVNSWGRSKAEIIQNHLPWIGADLKTGLHAGATIKQARAYARAVGARLVEITPAEEGAGR